MLTPFTSLKYWLQAYSKVDDIPELSASYARSGEIAKVGGREEDPREVANLLMNHPFAGFFYGFSETVDESQTFKVSIIHHLFKLEPGGIDYDASSHMVYGIEGLGEKTHIVEISSDMFEPSGDRSNGLFTPTIGDFVTAAGDLEKTKNLAAPKEVTATKSALGCGLDKDDNPIPIVLPRRFGIIPPVLMPAFQHVYPENILFTCLLIIKEFGAEHLNEEGQAEFWISCFPTLQLLWILSPWTHRPARNSIRTSQKPTRIFLSTSGPSKRDVLSRACT